MTDIQRFHNSTFNDPLRESESGDFVHFLSHKALLEAKEQGWENERKLYERTIEILSSKCL